MQDVYLDGCHFSKREKLWFVELDKYLASMLAFYVSWIHKIDLPVEVVYWLPNESKVLMMNAWLQFF